MLRNHKSLQRLKKNDKFIKVKICHKIVKTFCVNLVLLTATASCRLCRSGSDDYRDAVQRCCHQEDESVLDDQHETERRAHENDERSPEWNKSYFLRQLKF